MSEIKDATEIFKNLPPIKDNLVPLDPEDLDDRMNRWLNLLNNEIETC